MSDWTLNTPVAFLVFNRPDTTERVFEQIARARPPVLLIVADGPREGRPDEVQKCAEVRNIVDRINWPCKVLRNYSDVNLGCKSRVSSGLAWIFEMVPEAIILEDDCVPHPTFFRYCEELLVKYRDDHRVGMIGGSNFQAGRRVGNGDYYFSKYSFIWGWASWRRAWADYDVNMKSWPEVRNAQALRAIFQNSAEWAYWRHIFDQTWGGRIDTWDYQWFYLNWIKGCRSIVPNVNLISNIGCLRADATHTKTAEGMGFLEVQEITFPLKEPTVKEANFLADENTRRVLFSPPSAFRRALRKLKHTLLRS